MINEQKKTVLITGASGLIGFSVVNQLRSKGHKVIGCDISKPDKNLEGISWEKADVTDPGLFECLDKYDIDAVVHCAAHPGGKSLKEPAKDVHVNAFGSMQLFQWCANNDVHLVYLSSSVVYGIQDIERIPETAALRPGTIYGVCKVACENFLGILGKGYGLKWTVLRLFATYGAGHKPNTFQGIVNIMLTQLLQGNRVIVKGSLERKRDLLYVEDAASAIINSLFSEDAKGQIINVGTQVPTTIRDIIVRLCEVMGKNIDDIDIIEEEGTVGDPFSNVADCSKAREVIGFEPQYDLKKGLTCLMNKKDKG